MTSGKKTYAIIFEEGPGYILAEPLAHGSQGQSYLTISLADGKYYVRKQFNPEDSTGEPPKKDLVSELSFVPAQYLPRLFRTTTFERPNSDASIWEFCSGGDLGGIIKLYKQRAEPIPEVIIWQTAKTIVECLAFAHTGFKYDEIDTGSLYLPQIKHNDIHCNNIFLQWDSEDSLLPSIRLGDWGSAKIVSPDGWLPGFQLSFDVTCLWQTLVDMVEKCENGNLIYNRYKAIYPPDHPVGAFGKILGEAESLQRNDPSACSSIFVAQAFIPMAEERIKQLQIESVVDLRFTKPSFNDSLNAWQRHENHRYVVLQPWRWVKVDELPESISSEPGACLECSALTRRKRVPS